MRIHSLSFRATPSPAFSARPSRVVLEIPAARPITSESLKRYPAKAQKWPSLRRPVALLAMKAKQAHKRRSDTRLQADIPQLIDYIAFDRCASGRAGSPLKPLELSLPKLGLHGRIHLERSDYESTPKALHITVIDKQGLSSRLVVDVSNRRIQAIGNSTPIVLSQQEGPLFEGASARRLSRTLYDILFQAKSGLTPFKGSYIKPESRLAKVLRRVSRLLPF